MQQFLKTFVRPAWARVVAAELFDEFFVAVNNPHAAFDVRLGREASPALTGSLESKAGRDGDRVRSAWDTSEVKVARSSYRIESIVCRDEVARRLNRRKTTRR